MSAILKPRKDVVYPDSDGKPMADNTLQFRWIVTVQGGLDAQYRDAADVFVAGDLLWYPVEGEPSISVAPDTLVVFGRPKGYRGSYKQWEEGGIGPQVTFEILSPNNTHIEMMQKLEFYETYGVEEYYVYDPAAVYLQIWHREGGTFRRVRNIKEWVSPRLGIRFELGQELVIYGANGRPFASYLDLDQLRQDAERQAAQARLLIEQARQAEEQARHAAEIERQRVERLAAQLRALGQEPSA